MISMYPSRPFAVAAALCGSGAGRGRQALCPLHQTVLLSVTIKVTHRKRASASFVREFARAQRLFAWELHFSKTPSCCACSFCFPHSPDNRTSG